MKRIVRAMLAVIVALAVPGCGTDTAGPSSEVGEIVADFEGAALEAWTFGEDGGFDIDLAPSPAGASRWYSFRVRGRRGLATPFRIVDAQAAAWESAWAFERPVVSSDGGDTWSRVTATSWSGFFFRFEHVPASEDEWIAWVPVYNFSRWTERFEKLRDDPRVLTASVVGESLEGRPLHYLVLSGPEVPPGGRPAVWLVARQHPTETPGSWMLEGFLDWLLGGAAEADALLRAAEIHVVPFLNPDGVVNGHYRVNGAGLDLNRVWSDPDPARAPTVAATRSLLSDWVAGGGDLRLFVDLHGDPGSRKNYMFYNLGDETRAREAVDFMEIFEGTTTLFGAEGAEPIEVDTRLAQGWVGETFGVQAVTLEASFQDILHGPRGLDYMGVADYRELGEGLGRAVRAFWFQDDAEATGRSRGESPRRPRDQ